MPLSPPADRKLLHTRRIVIEGFERADGLFDIEARLTDQKTYGFDNDDRGHIAPGENLHGMRLRMTVDVEMLIVACEAVTEHGPYAVCPDGAASFATLAGLTIRPGFLKAANERVGGVAGCTHLREMLQQVATVAFQTLYPVRMRREEEAERRRREAGEPATVTTARSQTPRLLDTCFAYRRESPVVRRRWPHLYTGPDAPPPTPPSVAAEADAAALTSRQG